MKDQVSIIMPTFNSSEFVESAIDSVKEQTYKNWELVIVDDFSSDNTVQIINKIARNDNRIRLVKLMKNGGAANARNVAIKQSNGRFLAFLDSDDLWEPLKLEKQLAFMKEKDIAFSYTNYRMINENGEETGKHVKSPSVIEYNSLLKNTIIGCLTVMLDRQKIETISFPNVKPEDTALWLSILKKGYKAYCLHEEMAMYRLVKGSVSSNRIRAAKNLWFLLRKNENLPLYYSIWCFVNYSLNAVNKHYLKA